MLMTPAQLSFQIFTFVKEEFRKKLLGLNFTVGWADSVWVRRHIYAARSNRGGVTRVAEVEVVVQGSYITVNFRGPKGGATSVTVDTLHQLVTEEWIGKGNIGFLTSQLLAEAVKHRESQPPPKRSNFLTKAENMVQRVFGFSGQPGGSRDSYVQRHNYVQRPDGTWAPPAANGKDAVPLKNVIND